MMLNSSSMAHDRARAIYRLRRSRDEASGPLRTLFGEPGWDIMLDLFMARQKGVMLQVSAIGIDAGVASTTILRWLARLEKEDLINRTVDLRDGRRRLVHLTEKGNAFMFEVLQALGPIVAG